MRSEARSVALATAMLVLAAVQLHQIGKEGIESGDGR